MANLLTQAQIDELIDFDTASSTAVTGATNASPIVVTAATHGLATDDWVLVVNVGGNTAANGVFQVIRDDADDVQLVGSTGNGAYTSGGTIAKITGGMIGDLKPGEMTDLQAALNRTPYLKSMDADRSVESNLKTLIGS